MVLGRYCAITGHFTNSRKSGFRAERCIDDGRLYIRGRSSSTADRDRSRVSNFWTDRAGDGVAGRQISRQKN
jgi:hypothetical protein